MDLTCPKCHGPMRSYERNGVNVDQCTDCRGLFLDRGELERLTEGERRWHAEPPRQHRDHDDDDDHDHWDERRHRGHGGYRKKRKRSFFEELFD